MTNVYSPLVEKLLRFLRNMFHALFVFFPGFLFLFLTMVAFWDLSQGEDLMVLATVPHIRDAAAAGRRLKRNVAIGVAATAVLVVCATVAWRLLS